MKKQLIKAIHGYISDNKYQYAAVVAVLLTGLIWGAVSASSLGEDQYGNLTEYVNGFISSYGLQPISRGKVFITSLMSNLKTVFFLWLSALWTPLIPFTLFQIGARGYKMGFSVGFLVSAYKAKGVLFAVMTLMPQMFVFLPALTVYAVFSIRYAIGLKKMRRNLKKGTAKKEMYFRCAVCTLGMAVTVLVCSLLDAYVIPPVLKPVCSYMAITR